MVPRVVDTAFLQHPPNPLRHSFSALYQNHPKRCKVGDTLTAIVTPADAEVTYSWTAGDTVVGTEEELEVTEDMVGKKIKVKVTALDGDTKTSEETAAVTYDYPELVTAVRKAANSFTANFDSDASEIVKADDIEVISEDGTDVKKITGLDFSLDGTSAVVTVNTPFKDGVTYNVNYGDSTASFVASVGEVASIAISTQYAEVNTKTPIKFALFDENGVDVTSAVKVDETCMVTFEGDYDTYENSKATKATVTMTKAGDVCDVTVTYDKADGETEPIKQTKEIECIPASEKLGTPFFKAAPNDLNDTDECYRFYDPANSADTIVKVALDGNKLVHFYVQDTDGSAINYDSYEIETADETVATVEMGEHQTGKWADFTVYGNTKGAVLLTITASKNGAETKYDIPVTVTEQQVPKYVKVGLTRTTMSNAWEEVYGGQVSMKVYSADGEEADSKTYETKGFEVMNTTCDIVEDLKKDALYAGNPDLGFTLDHNLDADAKTTEYTAWAAAAGSYVIEGRVTDLTTGTILSGRNTVTVKALPTGAWLRSDSTLYKVYTINNFDGAIPTNPDSITGLTKEEHEALQKATMKTADEIGKLKANTIKVGDRTNDAPTAADLTDSYKTYANTATAGAVVLMTKDDATGKYTILDDTDDIIGAAVAANEADVKTIYQATIPAGGTTPLDANDTLQDGVKVKEVTPKALFGSKAPVYSNKLVLGQDAFTDKEEMYTLSSQTGSAATYSVELTNEDNAVITSLGYKDKNNTMTATLKATMGGLFAGYVRTDGNIGKGYVVPTTPTRIINLNGGYDRDITVQGYYGELKVGGSLLYGVGKGSAVDNPALEANANVIVGLRFFTTDETKEDRKFYTAEKDQAKYDEDFARQGTGYRVEFTFWLAGSAKESKEKANFSVKNDLYVPGVTVKSQELESYDQEGWQEAVVSEVDLNNNDPDTYSVINLVDSDGARINDSKTPAKWAVVTEESINFYKPLDRTFKLV